MNSQMDSKEVARRPADNAPTDAGHHDSAEPGPAHPSVSDGTMMRTWLPGRLPWRGRLSDPYPARASVPGVSSPLAFSALSRAGLLVLLSMALWLPMAPQAQAQTTVTLVSNTGKTAGAANTISSSFSFAQAFDTGSNPGGYNLHSIVVLLVAPTGSGTLTATVRADDSGTPSSTVLYTLTNPTLGHGLNEFTAPANATLNAGATYHVVLAFSESSGGPRWVRTAISNGLDAGASPGWDIDSGSLRYSASQAAWNFVSSSQSFQLQVKGSLPATIPDAPTGLTANPEDTQVTLNWTVGADGGSAIIKHRIRWKEGSGFYTGWQDIPNSAPSETNATSYTVTGLTNGTAYTFQVRAENGEGESIAPHATSSQVTPSATNTTAPTQTTGVLVSNMGQTPGTQQFNRQAQPFTTGTDTAVGSVEVYLDQNTIGTLVRIAPGASGGGPDLSSSDVITLTSPTTLVADAINTFSAPPNTMLTANTTYYVVTASSADPTDGRRVGMTTSTSEDSSPASGWSIGNTRYSATWTSTIWTPNTSTFLRIRINAPIRTGTITDTTAPTVIAFIIDNSPTNADTLTWQVTFDEDVKNVDAADFSVAGTTATLTAAAVTGSTSQYNVTATGGDLASLDATVTLSFAATQNIQDIAGNALTNTTPTVTNDNTYVVDNTAPTVTSVVRQDPASTPNDNTYEVDELGHPDMAGDVQRGRGSTV